MVSNQNHSGGQEAFQAVCKTEETAQYFCLKCSSAKSERNSSCPLLSPVVRGAHPMRFLRGKEKIGLAGRHFPALIYISVLQGENIIL